MVYLCYKLTSSCMIYLCYKLTSSCMVYLCYKLTSSCMVYLCYKLTSSCMIYLCYKLTSSCMVYLCYKLTSLFMVYLCYKGEGYGKSVQRQGNDSSLYSVQRGVITGILAWTLKDRGHGCLEEKGKERWKLLTFKWA